MKLLRCVLKPVWFCVAGVLLAAEPPSAPLNTFARKNEIKLFVTPANTEQALAMLKLDEAKAVGEMICLFDTADGAFGSQNLILRVRQKGDALGESTVKKHERILELLEISAKAKADTEEQAQTLAKQFFEAATAAGLGEPSGQTKTKQVLEFFAPGR